MLKLLYILLILGFVASSYMVVRTSPAWVAAGILRKGGFFTGILSVVVLAVAFAYLLPTLIAMLKTGPILFIIATTLFFSGTSAAVVIELLRGVVPAAEQWAESMHRDRFLLLWAALFALQYLGLAFLRHSP
jgi:hypothetical protein